MKVTRAKSNAKANFFLLWIKKSCLYCSLIAFLLIYVPLLQIFTKYLLAPSNHGTTEYPIAVPEKLPLVLEASPKAKLNQTLKGHRGAELAAPRADSDLAIDVVSRQETRSPKLHSVTYASHSGRDDLFCKAVESAVRHNMNLTILGWGVEWRGLSQKLEAAYSYAKGLPEDDVILFTDAFDVIFAKEPELILADFLSFKETKILFAGECGCWPHIRDNPHACFSLYPKSPTPYRYLNSGAWIGRARTAADMIFEVMKEAGGDFANANDQKLCADMYIEGRFGIKLDFHAKIFQSMHMIRHDWQVSTESDTRSRVRERRNHGDSRSSNGHPRLPDCFPPHDVHHSKDGRWKNTRTKTFPSVFHFNGGSKHLFVSVEGKLWYKVKKMNTKRKLDNLASSTLNVLNGTLRYDELCQDYMKNLRIAYKK